MMVAGGDAFARSPVKPLWPSTSVADSGRVPIVFAGRGVASGTDIPAGTGLDDIAGTLASTLELRRPHPEVRSGDAIDEVASGKQARLVLEIVWKGVGTDQLEAEPSTWPVLSRLMKGGAGTLEGRVGSLPLDPSAVIATVGTGGLPAQHGVTGTLLRFDQPAYSSTGASDQADGLVRAWTDRRFTSVISTLGDDLDNAFGQDSEIGLVGTDSVDRGLTGGNWYLNVDKDSVALLSRRASVRDQVAAATRLLRRGHFGRDSTPDLLGVVMSGGVPALDAALGQLVRRARAASDGSVTVAVTATGRSSQQGVSRAIPAPTLSRLLKGSLDDRGSVLEALVPGGLYLDQRALARLEVSDDVVLRALVELRGPNGKRVMADAFPAIAVTFGRFC
jgi:hypothetical protein